MRCSRCEKRRTVPSVVFGGDREATRAQGRNSYSEELGANKGTAKIIGKVGHEGDSVHCNSSMQSQLERRAWSKYERI